MPQQTRIVTYWPPPTTGGRGQGNGRLHFGLDPTYVEATWEGGDGDGDDLTGVDEVIVASDVEDGGSLLAGVSSCLDPPPGARKIHSCSKVPDLRTLKTIRVAVLED